MVSFYASLSVCLTVIHSTPKESTHFEIQQVGTQNLAHVGPITGYGRQLVGVPIQTKLSLQKKKSKGFQSFEAKFGGMRSVSQ